MPLSSSLIQYDTNNDYLTCSLIYSSANKVIK